MNKKTYAQILDAVAGDRVPAGLDLAPQVLSKIQKRKGRGMQPRVKALVMTALILLVLAAVAIAVPAVRATIEGWFGYVPGFGLVHEGGIRVLAAPVSVEQENVTLTVQEAVLSADKTIIKFDLAGITPDMIAAGEVCQGESPVLRLPDGSSLEVSGVGMDYTTGAGSVSYDVEATFAAMPAHVGEATLVVSCLPRTDPGRVPQLWQVPLRFIPAPADMTVAPVLSGPTPIPQPAFQGGLVLTKIIPTRDGYILAGTLTVRPPDGDRVDEWDGFLEDVTVTDANGRDVPYDMAPSDFLPEEISMPQPANTFGWTAQITGRDFTWPLTLTVHSVAAQTAPFPPAQFQFDAGPDPQVGQVWNLDQDVVLGPSVVHLVSVEMIQDSLGSPGYEFSFKYDDSIGFSLEIQGHSAMGGGGGGPASDGTITQALFYPDGAPSGIVTVILDGYGMIRLPGPWQVTWSAPASPGEPTPTP